MDTAETRAQAYDNDNDSERFSSNRTERRVECRYLIWHTAVRAGHPARLAPRTEEEPEAVHGVAHVERLAVGGVVHPSPPLDRLVRCCVDHHHPQVRGEQQPYPNIVVSLQDTDDGVDIAIPIYMSHK